MERYVLMRTKPREVVTDGEGLLKLMDSRRVVPVPVASHVEAVTPDAIYLRCNRGTQEWFSVWGAVWVEPRPFRK